MNRIKHLRALDRDGLEKYRKHLNGEVERTKNYQQLALLKEGRQLIDDLKDARDHIRGLYHHIPLNSSGVDVVLAQFQATEETYEAIITMLESKTHKGVKDELERVGKEIVRRKEPKDDGPFAGLEPKEV